MSVGYDRYIWCHGVAYDIYCMCENSPRETSFAVVTRAGQTLPDKLASIRFSSRAVFQNVCGAFQAKRLMNLYIGFLYISAGCRGWPNIYIFFDKYTDFSLLNRCLCISGYSIAHVYWPCSVHLRIVHAHGYIHAHLSKRWSLLPLSQIYRDTFLVSKPLVIF